MLMLPALTLGAIGCIDGPPCAAPELWVDIWNHWKDGNIEKAMKAQKKASLFTELMREVGVHSGTKAVLSERLGVDCGSGRLPNPPLEGSDREYVLDKVRSLGIEKIAAIASGD